MWSSLDFPSKAAEPPGCMLGSPTSPIPVKDTVVAKPTETAHAHQSRGAQHGHTSPPAQPGKIQFLMSSALSQQGFPARLCAPITMCSHRLQRVPFPCRHPNSTSSSGACRLSQDDPHTQGHAPGLGVGGDSRGHVSLWRVLSYSASPAQLPGFMPATCSLFLPPPWERHM